MVRLVHLALVFVGQLAELVVPLLEPVRGNWGLVTPEVFAPRPQFPGIPFPLIHELTFGARKAQRKTYTQRTLQRTSEEIVNFRGR